eukprot:TRINITY_DN3076_c0_g4_i1.p1 TRINITY_DN3076_c0_g4~~TRINITY_DN3076_c0_g4_i1.p1  ORF type:complete len:652 (-),score=222.41 TRINITY_DN3076_c0_g4_i1:139-2094(-)
MKNVSKALLLSGVVGASATSDGPGNPVSKVFTLLKDLRDKIEKDGATDEKNYEKYTCWCKNIEGEKNDAMKEQGDEIEKKAAEIEEGKATDEALSLKIKETVRSIDENKAETKAGAKARAEEAAKRAKNSADNKDSIADLSKAADKLQVKGGDGSTDQIMSTIKDQIDNTKSNEKEEAETEDKAVTAFNGWMHDMKTELGLLEKNEREARADKAENEKEMAEDTETKHQTAAQKEADKAALAAALKSCGNAETDYNNRVGMRTKELAGVNEALKILTEKRALFDKTFKEVPGVSFLQLATNARSGTGAAHTAYAALKQTATQTHSVRLARMAQKLQRASRSEGGFDAVLKSITEMMENLVTEAASDKKKKDHCNTEYQAVAKKSKNLKFLIQKGEATIDKLSTRLDEIAAETELSKDELQKTRDELASSKEEREKANDEFLAEKKMDEEAIVVLKDVLGALNKYYARDKAQDPAKAAFLQEPKYSLADNDENGNAANSVIALVERIVDNLGTEIKDDQAAEAKAVEDWTAQTTALKKVETTLVEKITNLGNQKATAETSKTEETDTKSSNDDALKAQVDYKAGIAEECDWILAKFDERTSRRQAETEGLARAKEVLSGASFVQKSSGATAPSSGEAEVPGSLSDYLSGGGL